MTGLLNHHKSVTGNKIRKLDLRLSNEEKFFFDGFFAVQLRMPNRNVLVLK